MERVSHKGKLCGAWSFLQMFNRRLLRISSYVLWFKVGVDKTIILMWASPEFSELAFLHIVECDWIFLGQVISNYVIHVIFNGFRRPKNSTTVTQHYDPEMQFKGMDKTMTTKW